MFSLGCKPALDPCAGGRGHRPGDMSKLFPTQYISLVNALLSDAKIIIRSPTSPYLLTFFLLPSTGTLPCRSSVLRKCFLTRNKRRESGETMRRLISPSTKESLYTLIQTPQSTLLFSLFLLAFPSLTPSLLTYLFFYILIH